MTTPESGEFPKITKNSGKNLPITSMMSSYTSLQGDNIQVKICMLIIKWLQPYNVQAKFQKLSIYLTRPLNHGYDEDKSLKLNRLYAMGACLYARVSQKKFPRRGGWGLPLNVELCNYEDSSVCIS